MGQATPIPIWQAELSRRFTYHPPLEGQPERYNKIRAVARALAEVIYTDTPCSREQSQAIQALEECMFWANAAIARNEV